ncbi:hypothetical protein WKK05_13190 [Nostoc sp. UHCC 0302]|uniref:hypothetical protein n=1 Tax=Nostoc sp. UHCC 0302 TaxID=3134896 RepID=UPI00311CCCD1
MGEAKRRRQLDANFGKLQMPDCLKGMTREFLNKQTDLEIMPVYDSKNSGRELTKRHLILPTPSEQNDARQELLKHQQQIMHPMTSLIQEHGKGWIVHRHNCRENCTDWGYIPATTLSLKQLQSGVFSDDLGLVVSGVIKYALESWSFEPSNQLIPVIAISNSNNDSSWLYCI